MVSGMGKVKLGQIESSLVWAPRGACLAWLTLVSVGLNVSSETRGAAHVVGGTATIAHYLEKLFVVLEAMLHYC